MISIGLLTLATSLVACTDDTTSDSGLVEDCAPGDICTWFGTPEIAGLSSEGTHRLDASTFWVVDVAFSPFDGSPLIMDWNNHRVITLDDNDEVVVLTGVGGQLGDGPEGDASLAEWNHPTDVAWLPDGSVVMAAWHNSRVVKFDPDFDDVEFIAGTGGRDFSGDGGPATDATLDLPCGIRTDADGNIYLADMANQRIRMIAPDGTIDTVAGSGEHGFNGDGPALETMLASPALQRAEPAFKFDLWGGDIYIADTHNGRVRKFDIDASTIETIAGMGETPQGSDNGTTCSAGCGYSGDGGPALEAMLDTPSDIAVGPDGTVYVADTENSCIRAITTDGIIDTFAGTCGEAGYAGDDSPATDALLHRPFGVSVDLDGKVYISDTYNSVIRVVDPG
jgi:sugar lactone lactonase YvrE